MNNLKKDSFKHLFVNLKMIVVLYRLYILETKIYVKQFSDPLINQSYHNYNTQLNRTVKIHNLNLLRKKERVQNFLPSSKKYFTST